MKTLTNLKLSRFNLRNTEGKIVSLKKNQSIDIDDSEAEDFAKGNANLLKTKQVEIGEQKPGQRDRAQLIAAKREENIKARAEANTLAIQQMADASKAKSESDAAEEQRKQDEKAAAVKAAAEKAKTEEGSKGKAAKK